MDELKRAEIQKAREEKAKIKKKELFKDFVLHEKCSKEMIDKYRDKVPPFLVEIWEEYGLGTFKNGYLKIINPDNYMEVLEDTYVYAEKSIPIFATAFADIITIHEDRYLYMVNYRRGDYDLLTGIEITPRFYEMFESERNLRKRFDNRQYDPAVKMHGVPAYDECFCYVPILGLGTERVENIVLGDLITHIYIITNFMGTI